jgi:hypothetical protein
VGGGLFTLHNPPFLDEFFDNQIEDDAGVDIAHQFAQGALRLLATGCHDLVVASNYFFEPS